MRFPFAICHLPFAILALTAGAANPVPPSRTMTWQGHIGIPGGIPNVSTIYTTINPSGGDDTPNIQGAINACPSNRVIKLASGNFAISTLDYQGAGSRGGIVLRGTTDSNLRPTTAITYNGVTTVGNFHIRNNVDGTYRSATVNLASDTTIGSTSVTLSSMPAWVIPGEIYWIDELDETNIAYCVGQEGTQSCTSTDRGLRQTIRVVSIAGNIITTEEPLMFPFKTSQTAQLAKCGYSPETYPAPKMYGLEDMYIIGGWTGNGEINTAAVGMEGAINCWVKNLISTNSPAGNHILFYFSYHCEVRHCSFLWSHAYGAGQGYGVKFNGGCANMWLEDNIYEGLHLCNDLAEGSMANVYSFNYEHQGHSDSGQNVWIGGHATVPWLNLAEGNHSEEKFNHDYVHGSAGYLETIFRNRVMGINNDPVPIVFEVFTKTNNVAGNCLGVVGTHTQYDAYPHEGGISENTSYPAVYRIGYWGSWAWHDNNPSSGTVGLEVYDTPTASSLLRVLNWDAANNSIADAGGFSVSDLPTSYVYSSKPAFFGTCPWPPFSPDQTSAAQLDRTNIPAGYRFVYGVDPPTNSTTLSLQTSVAILGRVTLKGRVTIQ